jgi:hypothetical protein
MNYDDIGMTRARVILKEKYWSGHLSSKKNGKDAKKRKVRSAEKEVIYRKVSYA